MKDSTKQNFDEIAADLNSVRKDNALSYWAILVFAGILVTGLISLIFRTTGIVLLVTAAFVYIMNSLVDSWMAMRKAEKDAVEATRKAAEKATKKAAATPTPQDDSKKPVRITR